MIEDAGLPRLTPFLLPLSCPMSFSERLPLVPRIGFVEAKPAEPDPPVKISSFLLFFLRASSLASSSEASRGRLSPLAKPPMFNAELQVNLCQKLLFLTQLLNPQYDDRLFIGLPVQYMRIPSSNLGRTCCVQKLILTFRTQGMH